jgi:hypothetical protein
VRIQISDDKGFVTTFDDQVFFVISACQGTAKDTAFLFCVGFDIFHTPGRPNPFHGLGIVAELGEKV